MGSDLKALKRIKGLIIILKILIFSLAVISFLLGWHLSKNYHLSSKSNTNQNTITNKIIQVKTNFIQISNFNLQTLQSNEVVEIITTNEIIEIKEKEKERITFLVGGGLSYPVGILAISGVRIYEGWYIGLQIGVIYTNYYIGVYVMYGF